MSTRALFLRDEAIHSRETDVEVAAALGSQVRGQPGGPPTGLPAVSKFYYLYGHTLEQASIQITREVRLPGPGFL